jgi:hypothetical protein
MAVLHRRAPSLADGIDIRTRPQAERGKRCQISLEARVLLLVQAATTSLL